MLLCLKQHQAGSKAVNEVAAADGTELALREEPGQRQRTERGVDD